MIFVSAAIWFVTGLVVAYIVLQKWKGDDEWEYGYCDECDFRGWVRVESSDWPNCLDFSDLDDPYEPETYCKRCWEEIDREFREMKIEEEAA